METARLKYRPISIWMDEDTLKLLNKIRAEEQSKRPVSSVSRSEIVRMLVHQGAADRN